MAGARFCEEFGRLFKEQRLRMGKTLREFCREHKFDHGNLSRIERGRAKPPTGDVLDKYLVALGVKRESNEWHELHNAAYACAGEVPEALMADEEVISKLPLLFRTLGARKLSRQELDKLIEEIRKA